MVRFENVTFAYNSKRVLEGFTLDVAGGRSTILIGPSGCGKSTILRLVNGLLKPQEGTVRVNGEIVSDDTLRDIRLGTGYVIQEGGLFPNMTAGGNITLMARRLGWDSTRIQKRIDYLCELTSFDKELLQSYPIFLSGGQRQRVSLMRALMLDPELLLLDEPFGALDPLIRAELQDSMREIFRKLNKTVLLVTHDMHEAAYLGDDIVLIRDGLIEQQGSADQLVQQPANTFVRDFIRAQRSHLPAEQ